VDSRIAATPSTAIWLGWLPRQRHRPIHDTAPPTSGPSGYIPSPLFPHYRRPSRNLRIAGIFEISSAPFANTALPPPAWRWHQLGYNNRFSHRLLRRRRPPTQLFSFPPLTGPKPPVALQLSSTAVTDDLSNPSSPAPRRPAFRRHRLSLAHLGSPPRPTIFQGSVCFFCVCFFFLAVKRPYSPTECSTASGNQTGSFFRFPTPFPFLKAHLWHPCSHPLPQHSYRSTIWTCGSVPFRLWILRAGYRLGWARSHPPHVPTTITIPPLPSSEL